MANQFLTISDITKESLRVLKNKLVFSQAVNRSYDSKFGVAGAKIGARLSPACTCISGRCLCSSPSA